MGAEFAVNKKSPTLMDGGLDIKVLTDQEKQSSVSGGQLQAGRTVGHRPGWISSWLGVADGRE